MSFFKSWSFSRKLMVVNSGYILPCVVLGYFLTAEQGEQIAKSQKERTGVAFIRPLQGLLVHAAEYRTLTHRLYNGDAEMREKVAEVRGLVEQDFTALEAMKTEDFEALRYSAAAMAQSKKEKSSVDGLKTDWQNIAAQLDTPTAAVADEMLGKFVVNVRTAIGHVANNSTLILDPTLDSFYTADAMINMLPEVTERAQQLVSYALAIGGTTPLTQDQKIAVHVLVAQFKDAVDRATAAVQAAIAEDKNYANVSATFQRDMPGALKEFGAATRALTREATSLAGATDPREAIKLVAAAGDRTMDTSLSFATKLGTELDSFLVDRISENRRNEVMDLIFALMTWVPIVVIASITLRRLSSTFITYAGKLESEAALANDSSVELASASQTVSAGSTEQAAAIQETGASMSEMTSMVSRSSTQAVSSQELAKKVKDQTDEGCQVIERLVGSMEQIQEANAQLQNISNIISAISEKTNIINDIVGKTQLLSFNASIEAARAGQHGRGFAVVAEEVGNLAQTSGTAAKEIRTLIDDSRQQVDHILKNTVARVVEGRSVTGQAQEIFSKIAKDISTISAQIESISEASREQQLGIEQIAKAMTQMDQGTQINNTAAFAAARLSDQLLGQSRKLTSIAQTIGVLVSGERHKKAEEHDHDVGPSRKAPAAHAHPTVGVDLSPGSLERTVTSLARGEAQLDQIAPTRAPIDANHESFKKIA